MVWNWDSRVDLTATGATNNTNEGCKSISDVISSAHFLHMANMPTPPS